MAKSETPILLNDQFLQDYQDLERRLAELRQVEQQWESMQATEAELRAEIARIKESSSEKVDPGQLAELEKQRDEWVRYGNELQAEFEKAETRIAQLEAELKGKETEQAELQSCVAQLRSDAAVAAEEAKNRPPPPPPPGPAGAEAPLRQEVDSLRAAKETLKKENEKLYGDVTSLRSALNKCQRDLQQCRGNQ